MVRQVLTAGAVLASASFASALCDTQSENIGGNWYCSAVNAITYTSMAGSGTYNRVTNMDGNSGKCSSEPFNYDGPQSVFGEELSIHLRGPMDIKQVAVYYPNNKSDSKAKVRRVHNERRHGHNHARFHEHAKQVRAAQDSAAAEQDKRAVGDMVTAVIDGKVVSWVNQYSGGAATDAPAAAPVAAAGNAAGAVANAASNVASQAAANIAPYVPTGNGDWIQTAYYNAANGTANGLTFLNNKGGASSGVFDYKFGNSLSYAASNGQDCAASAEVLADQTLPDNNELIIFSDKSCSSDNGCGYYRPGTVAYHGFGGEQKIFLFEFSMPLTGKTGFNMDMPALWFLNALIPRTLQYGDPSCTCWVDCGEFDIFEVLDSGNTRAKSTIHSAVAGGDSNYFNRPTSGTMKAAVTFTGSTATIKVLDDDFDFSDSMSNDIVSKLAEQADNFVSEALGHSLFTLG